MKLAAFVGFVGVAVAPASAGADIFNYQTSLSGPAESPPNSSPGTGFATLEYNSTAHTMHITVTFSGLVGTTTASHIHAATALPGQGTAGVATQTPTFVNFPLGVTSGTYDNTFDLTLASSFNSSYITANGGTPASAEAALMNAVAAGRAYLNVHSNVFPGGEIRGFWEPVPTPGVLGVMGLGGLAAMRRRR